jgi:hypothetical protein
VEESGLMMSKMSDVADTDNLKEKFTRTSFCPMADVAIQPVTHF